MLTNCEQVNKHVIQANLCAIQASLCAIQDNLCTADVLYLG